MKEAQKIGHGTDLPGLPGMEEIGCTGAGGCLDRQGSKLSNKLEEALEKPKEVNPLEKSEGVKHVLSQAVSALGYS